MQEFFLRQPGPVDRALKVLGIDNFLLGIHDGAFPSLEQEELGRGTPYSEGAAGFFQFTRSLGFTGIQLGPQGITTPANPSPYDSTFFSRNPLSLAPLPLLHKYPMLLSPEFLTHLTAALPSDTARVDDAAARRAVRQLTEAVCSRFRREIVPGRSSDCRALLQAYQRFQRQNAPWLERDGLYEALKKKYGNTTWKRWGNDQESRLDQYLFDPPAGREKEAHLRFTARLRRYAGFIEDFSFIQFLLADQHLDLRNHCRRLGLKLFGDCQIGLSGRDAWYAQSFLLHDYVLGAPPSRTNPDGQPWNYPVLDPRSYYVRDNEGSLRPGPAVRFVQARIEKLFDEFDGLRLDHPHGLVCPWVYQSGQPDPLKAVQQGARLFASPVLPEHPGLSRFAIVRPDQLNYGLERYDDNWVTDLEPEQVQQYARLIDVFMEVARKKCWGSCEIACEILSTQPYPIKRVMETHGLGRFRVTQKADLHNELDVYRSENAAPEDWLMLGNHDTLPVWAVAEKWFENGSARLQAEYLGRRLGIPEADRSAWLERMTADPGALVQAKFGDLFVGPARNIMVFFTDLFGVRTSYNRPGAVDPDNWALRLPPDYPRIYAEKLVFDQALNIPKALAMAIRARGNDFSRGHRDLLKELENL